MYTPSTTTIKVATVVGAAGLAIAFSVARHVVLYRKESKRIDRETEIVLEMLRDFHFEFEIIDPVEVELQAMISIDKLK